MLRVGKNVLCITEKHRISFALLASSCPFVVDGRHEIAIREACVDKGGLFLANKPGGHRTSRPGFLTVEEGTDVLRIGRTSAYGQARRYVGTKGAAGSCAGHERRAYQSEKSLDTFADGWSDLIASLGGVTKSAFGTGVFGESDDEQA